MPSISRPIPLRFNVGLQIDQYNTFPVYNGSHESDGMKFRQYTVWRHRYQVSVKVADILLFSVIYDIKNVKFILSNVNIGEWKM
jgi:hypothetical protein